jgi:hypothetical protein
MPAIDASEHLSVAAPSENIVTAGDHIFERQAASLCNESSRLQRHLSNSVGAS